jgi:hypothetical protein
MARSWTEELGALVERGVALQEALEPLADPRRPPPPADILETMQRWADDAEAFVETHLRDQLALYRTGLPSIPVGLAHDTARNYVDERLNRLRSYLAGDRVALREILTSTRSTDLKTTWLVVLTVAVAFLTLLIVARELHLI